MRIARLVCVLTGTLLLGCRSSERLAIDERSAYAPISAPCAVKTQDFSWVDATRNREVPVRLYLPQCGGTHPLIIFSHGIANSREGYAFLGRAWARAGYVAAHVQHRGSDTDELKQHGALAIYRVAKDPKHWVDRALDVTFAIDQIARIAPTLEGGVIDTTNVGVAGHSYGAFTALSSGGMTLDLGAGGMKSFRDPRVKAIVAMSTPKLPGAAERHAYDAITIPVLHMTGTRDLSLLFRTRVADRLVPFREIHNAPEYLVVLKDAGHSSFSDDERRPSVNRALHVRLMGAITRAFWDATLRHDARAQTWLDDRLAQYVGAAAHVSSRAGGGRAAKDLPN